MAHIFPGALWRPMPGQEKRPKRRKGRGVGFHIAVTERPSIYDINLGTGNDAHLYVLRDGRVEQNVDLDLVAYAGRDGNPSMVWVETQGGTTPADVKSGRWNPPQAETLAQIAAYLNHTEGTPLEVMPDSRPGSRGIGTHRLGIKHSLGVGAVPGWLVAGGELWSSSVGKECAGDARIAQVPEVVARARQITAGQSSPNPSPLLESEMYLVQTPDQTVWKVTDYDVSAEPGIYRMGALSKARGSLPIVKVTQEELNDNIADADARRARLLADIAKAAGGDVDESLIVAGLLPAITTALAGKVGASREEIAELLKGITLKAS